MSALQCRIEMDNPREFYQPGDTVSGRIVLSIRECTLIKALAVQMSGYAEVHWEELLPAKKQQRQTKRQKKQQQQQQQQGIIDPAASFVQPKQVFTDRQDYMCSTNYYIGSEEAFPKIIEPGVLTYRYNFSLPTKCPSSFECPNGQICYTLEVFVDYPNSRETCALIRLPVVKRSELPNDSELRAVLNTKAIEPKSFTKFWQHPLELYLKLLRGAYKPGESIAVHVCAMNGDRLSLSELFYKLNMVITCASTNGSKRKTKMLRTALVSSEHFLGGSTDAAMEHLQLLQVPSDAMPTQETDCDCLQASYEVEVCLKSAKTGRSVSIQLPVAVVTSIPPYSYSAEHEKAALSSSEWDSQPLNRGGMSASQPALLMACSVEAMSEQEAAFGNATAPEDETSIDARSNATGIAMASSFREADYKQQRKRYKSSEQLDFKPKYLYYEAGNTPLQNEEVSSTNNAKAP